MSIYISLLILVTGLCAPGLNEEPKHGDLQAAEGGGLLRHRRGTGEVRGCERQRGCEMEPGRCFSWCTRQLILPQDSWEALKTILRFIYLTFIECIGVTLVNKTIQVSSVQFYNTSSVIVCSPFKVKSPSITIYPPLPSSTSPILLSFW